MPWAHEGGVRQDRQEDDLEITDAQYASAIEGVLGGKVITIDGGFAIVDPPAPPTEPDPVPPTLEQVKAYLKMSIDAIAEDERLRHLTAGAGQALIYTQKADEATRFLTAENPAEADFPLLNAEVGITGSNIAGVAKAIGDAVDRWRMVGAQIEAVRLRTKRTIDAAQTIEEAQAAANAAWPLPA